MTSPIRSAGEHRPSRPACQDLYALVAPGDAFGNRPHAEATGNTLEPAPSRTSHPGERRRGAPTKCVEPVARTGEPTFEQSRMQTGGGALQLHGMRAGAG